MSMFREIKNTLKGYGSVVAREIASASRAMNEVDALAAEKAASAAFNRSKAISNRRDVIINGEKWLAGMLAKLTRHDSRKAANIVQSFASGAFIGAECQTILPFVARSEGRVERFALESAGMYSNNKKTFVILLEKIGALKSIRDGRSIVAYELASDDFWNAIRAIDR